MGLDLLKMDGSSLAPSLCQGGAAGAPSPLPVLLQWGSQSGPLPWSLGTAHRAEGGGCRGQSASRADEAQAHPEVSEPELGSSERIFLSLGGSLHSSSLFFEYEHS